MEYIQGAPGTEDADNGTGGDTRVLMEYAMPLSEMLADFYNQLKSRTQGYASLDYSFDSYRGAPLVKLDVLLIYEAVDALSMIVHRDRAQQFGRALVERLRTVIPRQLFDVPISGCCGDPGYRQGNSQALRKDVLAKCYGGDVTRKRKLLERQKEGKKRLKRVGRVGVTPGGLSFRAESGRRVANQIPNRPLEKGGLRGLSEPRERRAAPPYLPALCAPGPPPVTCPGRKGGGRYA